MVVEHVGSTSVPGLAAKPFLDVLLLVPDPGDEAAYVPRLEAAGFLLHVREPDWHEHRFFRAHDPEVQIHVFARGLRGGGANAAVPGPASGQRG